RERVGDQADPELTEEGARDRAEGDPCGRLACAGPLEHVARLREVVLLHAHEVGVARTRPGEGRTAPLREGRRVDRRRRHDVDPARPLRVADAQRDGAAHRAPEADAARDRELVLLELHARAATVAELPTLQIRLDLLGEDRHIGGHPLEDGHQFGAVRLTGRQPTQHALDHSTAERMAWMTRASSGSGVEGSPETKIRIWCTAWCNSISSPLTPSPPAAAQREASALGHGW